MLRAGCLLLAFSCSCCHAADHQRKQSIGSNARRGILRSESNDAATIHFDRGIATVSSGAQDTALAHLQSGIVGTAATAGIFITKAEHHTEDDLGAEDGTNQCKGHHGTFIGGPACCGQTGSIEASAETCPANLPYCRGYQRGEANGKCVQEKPRDEWTCHEYVKSQNTQWCQTAPVLDEKMYRFFPSESSPCGGCECCVKDMPEAQLNLAGPLAEESMVTCDEPMALLSCTCHSYGTACAGAKMKSNRCYASNSKREEGLTVQAHAICGVIPGSGHWTVVESRDSANFHGATTLARCSYGMMLTGCTCVGQTDSSCKGVLAGTGQDGRAECKAVKNGDGGEGVKAQARCGSIPGSRQWTEALSSKSSASKGARAKALCPEGAMLTGCSCISGEGRCDGAIADGKACFAYNGHNGAGVVAQARCGMIPEVFEAAHLPECVYDQCDIFIVKGAGYTPANGIYKPVSGTCDANAGYGSMSMSDANWPAFENKDRVRLVWSWGQGVTRGWKFVHHGRTRYYDGINRLSPKAIVFDSFATRSQGSDGGVDPAPRIECYQKQAVGTVDDITEPDQAVGLTWTAGWSNDVRIRSADGYLHGMHGYGPRVSKTFKELPPHDVIAISSRYWCTGAWKEKPFGEVALEYKALWTKHRPAATSCQGWGKYGEEDDYFLKPIRIKVPGFSNGRNVDVYQKVDEKLAMRDFCFTDVATGIAHTANEVTVSLSSGGTMETALHPKGPLRHPEGGLFAFNRFTMIVGTINVGPHVWDEDGERKTNSGYGVGALEEQKKRDDLKADGVDLTRLVDASTWNEVDMVEATDGKGMALTKVHGFFSGAKTLIRTWNNLEQHDLLQVQLRFYFIDRWQGEDAIILLDSYEVWRRSHHHAYPGNCQPYQIYHENIPNPWQGDRTEDKCYADISVVLPHNASSAALKILTTLHETTTVELASWGFSAVRLQTGHEAWAINQNPPTEAPPPAEAAADTTAADEAAPTGSASVAETDTAEIAPITEQTAVQDDAQAGAVP